MRVCSLVVWSFAAAFSLTAPVVSAKDGATSPSSQPLHVASGRRVVAPLDSAELLPLADLKGDETGEEKGTSHKRGGRPRVPRAQLPESVPLSQPSEKSRRGVAQGPSHSEQAKGAPDEELEALRSAEKVLFPRRVRGLESGWAFQLPTSDEDSNRALGLPLRFSSDAREEVFSKEDIAWLRSLTLPDLPVRLDRRVVTYLKFYRDSHRGRTIAAIWARKSGRYVAEIKAKLRRAGLPTDLVWLSMIESGHNPTIKSPAGAMGLWQFMPASGRMYGLTVDRWVDERRDPARSTQAAIRFLGDLHQRFGNWELAMGAYNMGYAGMSRAIAKYNTNDYWALSRLESGIPWETTLYVPKIVALAIVMNNREAFGVGRTKLDPAQSFDTILLEPATPLKEIARAAGVSHDELAALNPQFLSNRLPPQESGVLKKWAVRVPMGSGESALAKVTQKAQPKLQPYRVRQGDSAALIAADYGVTESELRKANALERRERLEPKTVLLLPRSAKRRKDETRQDVVASRELTPASGQTRVFYQVQSGDQLEDIALAFGVAEADLAGWNVIDTQAPLHSGMSLQLLVQAPEKLKEVRFVPESQAHVLLAGSPEFHEHFESLKGKARVQITVSEGDTLYKLGARYGMSVGSMERVNRRSRKAPLIPGERLIVYTERQPTASQQGSAPEALPQIQAPRPELLP